MEKPNRRLYEDRMSSIEKRAIQAVRQAGDGVPAHESAKWGLITGTLDDQQDLRLRTDDLESKAALGDDGS